MSGAPLDIVSVGGVRYAGRISVAEGACATLAALVAWVGLLLLGGFLWTKIAFSTGGTGWMYLPACAVCVATVMFLRLRCGARLSWERSVPWVTLFVIWFLARLLLDAASFADVRGYTIGYAEGILFGYGSGMAVRILLDGLAACRSHRLRWAATMLLLVFNAWSAGRVEESAISAGSFHRDYALFYNDTYQLSGALTSVLTVLLASLVVRAADDSQRGAQTLAKWMLLVTAVVTFATMARLAQLLGSNSAPVFIFPVAMLSIATAWIALGSPAAQGIGHRADSRKSFRRVLVSVGVVSFALATTCAAVLVVAVAWGAIDITQYRAFGFEDSSLYNSSIDSRLHILAENFPKHLVHSPIFGNFFVDRVTTGDGSYAHGLIAVVPHLGIVGAILFIAMLVGIGTQLRSQWRASRRGGREARFAMLAILLTAWAVSYMLLTTFFTNIILWMSIGLFAPALRLRERPKPTPP